MVKKVLGGMFFVGALLMLIGAIANGTLFSDQGSAAATYGTFLGTLIPIVLYVFSGIFLLTFDNPVKMDYIDGFKKRSKQSSVIIVLAVVYGVVGYIVAMGAGAKIGASVEFDFSTSAMLHALGSLCIVMLPYSIPFMVFVCMWLMYARPHQVSKKYFLNSDAALNQYLSIGETFHAYSNDNTVLASDNALFFPTLFCAIPFTQIASTKLTKQLWEQDVYFNLSNGKKFYIVTKHYDRIQEAISAYSQVQQ